MRWLRATLAAAPAVAIGLASGGPVGALVAAAGPGAAAFTKAASKTGLKRAKGSKVHELGAPTALFAAPVGFVAQMSPEQAEAATAGVRAIAAAFGVDLPPTAVAALLALLSWGFHRLLVARAS